METIVPRPDQPLDVALRSPFNEVEQTFRQPDREPVTFKRYKGVVEIDGTLKILSLPRAAIAQIAKFIQAGYSPKGHYRILATGNGIHRRYKVTTLDEPPPPPPVSLLQRAKQRVLDWWPLQWKRQEEEWN